MIRPAVYPDRVSVNPPPSQPLPPEIFYGRDELILKLAEILSSEPRPRISILGAGGMGKTSTALHLIHHELVAERYGHRRYFVACDAVTSAEALAFLILQILEVTLVDGENPITAMYLALTRSPPTLLLLDNFESVWDAEDADSTRIGIRDLLQKIAGVPSAALIVTMRASAPPTGIVWKLSETIPPLSHSSARDVFLKINHTFLDEAADGEQVLNDFLQELDCVPLAITLLAQVSLDLPLAFVLRLWREKKTSMLRLPSPSESRDRLESVDVSISISITALDIIRNPEAIQLLGMICLLPDGLFLWQERLDSIGKSYSTTTSAMLLLRKFALIYIAGDKLGVLSPIRHFVLQYHSPDPEHTQCIYNIFWELVDAYAPVEFGPEFNSAVQALRLDMGNIASVIDHAARFHPSPKLVDIVIKLSRHLYRTHHPSTSVLHKIAHLVPNAQPRQKAEYWQIMGEILYMQDKYADARRTLIQARDQFLEIGDALGAARCLRSLGDNLRMQDRYTEATDILNQARAQLLDAGDLIGSAQCLQSLGTILRMQEKYTESLVTCMEAHNKLLALGNRRGAAQCLGSVAEIYRMQHRYQEATVTFNQVRDQLIDIGDRHGAARVLWLQGNILRMHDGYTTAKVTLNQARAELLDVGDWPGAARCMLSLGDNLRMHGNHAEAIVTLTEARSQLLNFGDHRSASWCLWSLGEIHRIQNNQAQAMKMVEEADRRFLAIGERSGDACCRCSLGDIHLAHNRRALAAELYTQARDIFLQMESPHDATRCSKRLSLCTVESDCTPVAAENT